MGGEICQKMDLKLPRTIRHRSVLEMKETNNLAFFNNFFQTKKQAECRIKILLSKVLQKCHNCIPGTIRLKNIRAKFDKY